MELLPFGPERGGRPPVVSQRTSRAAHDVDFSEAKDRWMYESFFGLRKRPFAAVPDADMLVGTAAVADAIQRIDRCVRQGRGIAVLTAAAGLGKTHLLHRLAREWGDAFRAVLLPNAGFPTRRGLLQAVLAELDQPYQRLGETELRLELTAFARAAAARNRGLVLLFDEAHRYSERVLEEIRLVANLVENGEPLVRVVLAGQLDLEEKLAEPSLAGLNERVGELVMLPRLTTEESRQYLRDRASFAGADLENLVDSEAAELIVRACGGVPRSLNQLADHALLLGYVAERRPIREGLVREALEDLKRLPLQWHDPLPEFDDGATVVDGAAEGSSDVIEFGGLSDAANEELQVLSEPGAEHGSAINQRNFSRDISAVAPRHDPVFGQSGAVRIADGSQAIFDRFARLDAADALRRWFEDFDPAEEQAMEQRAAVSSPSIARPETRPAINPLEILDRIEPLVAEALDERSLPPLPSAAVTEPRMRVNRIAAALEPLAVGAGGPIEAPERRTTGSPQPERRHSTLFSDLRRRVER